MSAAAVPIYQALLGQGIGDSQAKAAAEAAAQAIAESGKGARQYADQKTAETEKDLRAEIALNAERAETRDAQTRRESVSRDEFHQRLGALATRAELAEFRVEMRAEFAEIRTDIRTLYRLLITLLVVVGGSALATASSAVYFVLGS